MEKTIQQMLIIIEIMIKTDRLQISIPFGYSLSNNQYGGYVRDDQPVEMVNDF